MIIKIWDGSKKPDEGALLKGVHQVNTKYNRDIVTPKGTTITIVPKGETPEYGDIVTTSIMNISVFGMITDVKNNEPSWDITIFWNTDVNTTYLNQYNGIVEGFDITDNNESQYTQVIHTSDTLTIDSSIQKFNTLCNKSMIASPKIEEATQYEDRFEVVLTDSIEDVQTIKLTNPNISNVQITLSDDTYNALTLRNQDDLTQYEHYYLTEDREVTTNKDLAQRPLLWNREDVTAEEYADISVATTKIKQQSYSNSVQLRVPLNNSILPLNFNNGILSRRVNVLTKEDYLFETIITGIDIENEMMTVTFGITRNNILGTFIKLQKGI